MKDAKPAFKAFKSFEGGKACNFGKRGKVSSPMSNEKSQHVIPLIAHHSTSFLHTPSHLTNNSASPNLCTRFWTRNVICMRLRFSETTTAESEEERSHELGVQVFPRLRGRARAGEGQLQDPLQVAGVRRRVREVDGVGKTRRDRWPRRPPRP